MVRLSVLASLLLSLAIPCKAASAPLAKEAEVNGVRIQYLEDGAGEPVVFVYGVISDHRTWDVLLSRALPPPGSIRRKS